VEGHGAGQHLRADELVKRVVPPDVLADRDEFAVRREQTRSVQATGLIERLLCRS
jgi:hypothetical protein